MTASRLALTRAQILAYRRSVGALDERLPFNATSLRRAAWAGLQDSMPRAALLSIHARVDRTTSTTWEHPSLVQVWGPRFSAYVVPERDAVFFTLGRFPADARGQKIAQDLASRLHTRLAGRRLPHEEAVRPLALGHPSQIRYATTTGRIRIRWAGAREPILWTAPAPGIDPLAARVELARRYLHVFGPTRAEAFGDWAGISLASAVVAFDALARSLTPVRTPIGDAWILSSDERMIRSPIGPAAPARLLPSGDTFFLLQGADRSLLVPDAKRRGALWTPRVWPGALLIGGDVAGTWRRAGAILVVGAWRRLSRGEREAVEVEAASMPLPDVGGPIRVRWED